MKVKYEALKELEKGVPQKDDEDDPFAGLEEEDSLKTLESDLVYLK